MKVVLPLMMQTGLEPLQTPDAWHVRALEPLSE